tara:strand:+ start:539 stop:1297 length:759 start_codon:yes stop_codon:yes gene_type:complete
MLLVKKDCSMLVYSVGKTGTTSLLKSVLGFNPPPFAEASLYNDLEYIGIGEGSARVVLEHFNLIDKDDHDYIDQYEGLKRLIDNGATPHFVIRDPWQRYVSGVKEILSDLLEPLYGNKNGEMITELLLNNPLKCEDLLNRFIYLTEYDAINLSKYNYKYLKSYAINDNYHTRNWLKEISHFKNKVIIESKNIDKFTTELGFTPVEFQNTTNKDLKASLDQIIKKLNLYFVLEEYLSHETEEYKRLPDKYTSR